MMLGRTWISWRRAALVMVLGASLVACGDDDGDRPPLRDAGNGGLDGGGDDTDAGGGGDTDGGGGSPDGGGTRVCMPSGGMCDVMLQNCPNATDGCYFGRPSGGTTDTTVCAPAGTAGEGATCDSSNDCLPGLACSSGVCRTYCCDGLTSDCPSGSGQTCIGIGGAGNIGTCTAAAACTLVPPAGCSGSQACYPVGNDGTLGCFGAGTATEGMECEFLNSCAPGHACLGSEGSDSTCHRFCRIDMGAGDCSSGRTCQMVSGITLPANIGICAAASGS